MKNKLFDNGRICIEWDNDSIKMVDTYNSFRIVMDKSVAKYFIYCTEILYKINKANIKVSFI